MKEFLLLIKTEGDYCEFMTAEEHKQHLKKVSAYIADLTKEGKLKGAQPLSMNGETISGKRGIFKDGPFTETKEVIIGYYLVLAKDLQEAKEIAKANPVFQETNARIEVREIKKEEGIN